MSDLSLAISLLRHAPTPAWLMDREGGVLHANQAALDVLGRAAMGSELDTEWNAERHARVFDRAQQGKETRFERSMRVGDQVETFLVVVPPSPIPQAMVAWLHHDRVTDGLIETERLASMGALAAGVAHEIRNPLTYLSGNLAVLEREMATSASRMRDHDAPAAAQNRMKEMLLTLAEARQGSARVATIVDELRSFSRSGETSLVSVDPLAVLDAAINMASTQFRHHADLERNLRPVPRVLAHETRLAQVFVNLLMNASQATAESADARISVRTELRHDGVIVEISDNGGGIPGADIDQVFEPFYTTKPAGIGTGLGLPICRRILRSFDGHIEVARTGPEGTTMRVTLPPLLEEALSDSWSPTPTGVDRKSRVLIVDDEPLVCSTLRRGLGDRAEVRTACSVQDALEALENDSRVDAIVCDVMMPNLGGADLYQAIQERFPELSSRVIFMTGGTLVDRVYKIISASKRPVLEKPFDLDVLQRLVAELRQG